VFVRRIGIYLAAGLLALANPAGLAFAGVAPADANADGRVDVLDLQALASTSLYDAAPAPNADLNGDGSVDVLDYQRAVAHATGEPPSSADPPQESPSSSTIPSITLVPAPHSARTSWRLEDFRTECRFSGLTILLSVPDCVSLPSEQNLFCLAPNAPPASL
jgi:hypothetical protein